MSTLASVHPVGAPFLPHSEVLGCVRSFGLTRNFLFPGQRRFGRYSQAVILGPALRQRGLLFDRARCVAAAVRRRGFFPFNQCIYVSS
jgi:hypothetical protein